jgi:hypothetical protein
MSHNAGGYLLVIVGKNKKLEYIIHHIQPVVRNVIFNRKKWLQSFLQCGQ